jgi:hypothetical protein
MEKRRCKNFFVFVLVAFIHYIGKINANSLYRNGGESTKIDSTRLNALVGVKAML